VQESVWKYQSAFLLFPARLHFPVIVLSDEKGVTVIQDAL